MIDVPYKVLLPNRIWGMRADKEAFIQEVKTYMQRYPEFKPRQVINGFVLCDLKEGHNGHSST